MTTEAGQALTQEEALFRAICQEPNDDAPRLVYADLLDERAVNVPCGCGGPRPGGCAKCGNSGLVSDGRQERAEFIRVQCEIARRYCPWCEGKGTLLGSAGDKGNPECDCGVLALRRRERELFEAMPGTLGTGLSDGYVLALDSAAAPSAVVRRGFVDEIRLPLRDFVGGPCGRCEGTGQLRYYCPREIEGIDDCPDCKGTSRVEGLAGRLFSQHPITRVLLTDREPDESFWWWRDGDGTYRNSRAYLPSEIFNRFNIPNILGLNGVHFVTRDIALAAASNAFVAYGRSQVDWLRAYDERKVAACRRGTTGG